MLYLAVEMKLDPLSYHVRMVPTCTSYGLRASVLPVPRASWHTHEGGLLLPDHVSTSWTPCMLLCQILCQHPGLLVCCMLLCQILCQHPGLLVCCWLDPSEGAPRYCINILDSLCVVGSTLQREAQHSAVITAEMPSRWGQVFS